MNIGVICHNHNSVFMASVSDLSVVVVVPASSSNILQTESLSTLASSLS